jgi:putative transposase
MRQRQYTLTRDQVHAHASRLVLAHVGLRDVGRRCTAVVVVQVLFAACARLCSLFAICGRLRDAPCDESVRQALLATLPGYAELQRRLNRALQGDLPRALRRRRYDVAIDLFLIPYHGRPQAEETEIVRGAPRSGTSHFHGYATAYVVRKGRRYTVALTGVGQGDASEQVIRRLLHEAARAGVRPRVLLLDRGYWKVNVVRYLQAARQPFVVLVPCQGRKPDHPRGVGGTQVLCYQRRSGWHTYQLRDTSHGRTATVRVGVRVTTQGRAQAQRGRRRSGASRHRASRGPGRPYAFWGWEPASYKALAERYRRRFAIETSYRQVHQARIRTSSRSPLLRLLYVGLALLLRNVWVWVHYQILARPRRGGRLLRWGRLRFRALLAWLEDVAVAAFGLATALPTELPVPATLPPSEPATDFGNY